MAKHRISNSSDFTGDWFLPQEGPNNKIAGTLTWAERASLQLHDTFNAPCGPIFGDEVHSYDVIHGTTTKSQHITVLEASRTGLSWNFGQAGIRQPEKLISSWVVIGAHVDRQTLYTEIRACIPGLQIWLSRFGVQQTIIDKTDKTTAGVIYEIYGLAEECSEIRNSTTVLGWGVDREFGGDLSTTISVATTASLRIHSDEPRELSWFFEQLGKATTLLSFITGGHAAPNHVTAKVAGPGTEVEILVALRESKHCTLSSRAEFFMLRDCMQADLADVFARWFDLYDSVAMPSQLALSVLSSEVLWPHIEFLSLMQALEGFHRATAPGLYTSEEAYSAISQALCGAIPSTVEGGHKEALRARIKYGNEISLRKRLNDLAGRLDEPLRKQILGGSGSVPATWIATRNYYTHWDEASRVLVLDGLETHRAGVRLRLLLRTLYLIFVGIPQSAIAMSLQNASPESQYLIQLNGIDSRKRDPGSTTGMMMTIGVKDPENPREH